ncbi:MAG TPA: Wzz/FepE/Etk N-terminal domain-containing protein [Bacteroidota bacterium]|nr:Wzz/FepE/Etk N-terminal domain-containing protein [Bacteroidota bacterium]
MSDTVNKVPNGDIETWRLLLRTVWQRRRTVLGMMGAVTVVMLVYVLIMPQTFTSTVTLLPPQKDQGSMNLGSLLQGASSLPMFDIGSSLGFGGRPSDVFGEILKSQSVAESLIVQHDLARFFGVPEGESYRHAIKPLAESSEIDINKNGLIRVSVTLGTGFFASAADIDSVKRLAAAVANDYVLWLDRVNRDKLVSSARNSRRFIEEELGRTQAELDSAYARLVQFQRENKSVFLEKQMEAALTGAADIREKLTKARVELGVARRDFAEHSRVVAQLQSQIEELSRQYAAMASGSAGEDYAVPFQRVPEVAREMAGLMRDVKILEQVILFLSQQYYEDRVQEARDTPTVQVLDQATPAIQRTSPRRAAFMLMTVFVALLASVGYVMLSTWLRTRRALPSA